MSKNIYKEVLYGDRTPKNEVTNIRVNLEKIALGTDTRFILTANVILFHHDEDYDGDSLYDFELLLKEYTSRENAIRLAVTIADDLKNKYLVDNQAVKNE